MNCNHQHTDQEDKKEDKKELRLRAALRNWNSLPDSANVRQPLVEALFACSAATIWRRVHAKTLPAPRKLSERVTAWQVGELRRALSGCK